MRATPLREPARLTKQAARAGAAALMGIVAATSAARAGEYRYCLARATDAPVAYVTPAFASDERTFSLAARYSIFLSGAGLPHQGAHCPRVESRAEADAMRQRALEFLAGTGNASVAVDWHG